MTELITMVIYDVEDDWARSRVAETCKDLGLTRIQYSCFSGKLSGNKREELYERFRKIQSEWQKRWYKDLPESRFHRSDSPDFPDKDASGCWQPAFKILIQPLCEKDIGSALYAYLFMDVPQAVATGTNGSAQAGPAPERDPGDHKEDNS
jgi:hypothetical protein